MTAARRCTGRPCTWRLCARPGPWRAPWPAALALLAACGAAAQAAPAASCAPQLAGPARQVAEGRGLTIVFAPRPWPVAVGRHFALDVAVCAAPGTALPATLRVDADMPAHRHGMNYRPTVRPLGDGRFSAEGLMFHMPGRWRVLLYPDSAAPLSRELDLP